MSSRVPTSLDTSVHVEERPEREGGRDGELLPEPQRLTGGPEVAPRVHSDLAGPAARLWEIPAERGGAGREQSEEQQAAEQPNAPRPQGHGWARATSQFRCTWRRLRSPARAFAPFKPAPLGAEPSRGARPRRAQGRPGPALSESLESARARVPDPLHRPHARTPDPTWAWLPQRVRAQAHQLQAEDGGKAGPPRHSQRLLALLQGRKEGEDAAFLGDIGVTVPSKVQGARGACQSAPPSWSI